MSDERRLRKALIRLAHDNKVVRPHILPLLQRKQAGDVEDSYDKKVIFGGLEQLATHLALLNPERKGGIYAPLSSWERYGGDSWTEWTIEGYFYDKTGKEHSFKIIVSSTYEEGLLGVNFEVDGRSKYSGDIGQSSIMRGLHKDLGKVLERFWR